MIKNLLLVGLGGGIGSIARYLCQKWFSENYPHPFPGAHSSSISLDVF
jgi:CrcB protein